MSVSLVLLVRQLLLGDVSMELKRAGRTGQFSPALRLERECEKERFVCASWDIEGLFII